MTRRCGPLLMLLALTLATGVYAREPELTVRHVDTHLEENVYRLDAQATIELGDEPRAALRAGVPLEFVAIFEIVEVRKWLWDRTVTQLTAHYVLAYNPLSKQYRLEFRNAGDVRNYRSLERSLKAMGNIHNFPLLDIGLLEPGKRYAVRFRMQLDVEALPAPLRPVAYVSPAWRLDSGWYQWPIQP